MRDSEVDYAIEAINSNPENESPWRYLHGLYNDENDARLNDSRVPSACLRVLKAKRNFKFALSTLLDLFSCISHRLLACLLSDNKKFDFFRMFSVVLRFI